MKAQLQPQREREPEQAGHVQVGELGVVDEGGAERQAERGEGLQEAEIVKWYVNPGDEVLIFDPYFVMYPQIVALAGGVFQNGRLLTSMVKRLERDGCRVLVPRLLPPNDGGISYGQAAVAAARLARGA